jgi:hypothetical protein
MRYCAALELENKRTCRAPSQRDYDFDEPNEWKCLVNQHMARYRKLRDACEVVHMAASLCR